MNSSDDNIVITGLGVLTSLGSFPNTVWNNVISENTFIEKSNIKIDETDWCEYYKHTLIDFNIDDYGLHKHMLSEISNWCDGDIPNEILYLFAVIKRALDDSRVCEKYLSDEIGVILTCEGPGLEMFFSQMLDSTYEKSRINCSKFEYYKDIFQKNAQRAYNLQTFMPVYFISKLFGLNGFNLFINNACCSGLHGIELGASLIKSKRCKAVVVAGSDYSDYFKFLWFDKQKMYSKDGVIRPFSNNSTGYVFGDGGGAVTLERLKVCKGANEKIYGEYLSGEFTSQGWKVTLPSVVNNRFSNILRKVIDTAHISLKDVDFICSHGVGLSVSDRYEAKSIGEVFDRHMPFVSAFKPYFGHNLGGNALIDIILSLLALEKNVIPRNMNCNTIGYEGLINLTQEHLSKEINTFMKISTGFAGFEGCALFRKI